MVQQTSIRKNRNRSWTVTDRTHTGGKHGYHYSQKEGDPLRMVRPHRRSADDGSVPRRHQQRHGLVLPAHQRRHAHWRGRSGNDVVHLGIDHYVLEPVRGSSARQVRHPHHHRGRRRHPGGLLRRAVAGRRGVGLLRAGRHHGVRLGVRHAAGRPHDDQPLVQR